MASKMADIPSALIEFSRKSSLVSDLLCFMASAMANAPTWPISL